MKNEVNEEYKKRHPNSFYHLTCSHKNKLILLIIVISTNLLTLSLFRRPSTSSDDHTRRLIASLLNSTHHQIAELERKLAVTETTTLPAGSEASLSVGTRKLPLGFSPKSNSDTLAPSIGAACLSHPADLLKYLTYNVGGVCPSDDVFAQKLLLRGCEPLPRRRCKPKSPRDYVGPTPLPESLWATPDDSSVVWDPYSCKSYECLVGREKRPGFYDCKDCSNLKGREKARWMLDNNGLDFSIQSVLATKPPGSVRLGLDIGGGSGTFAARMRERNITIVTSSMNLDGPFNSFIASRGLIPIHMSVSERFPFFDNTLDIVHSMHILSNWIPEVTLDFVLYDVYRVLRPGGLFWLDRFFCRGDQMNRTYIPMIERLGFNKLRWFTGKKYDRDGQEWYLSALLEKPMT